VGGIAYAPPLGCRVQITLQQDKGILLGSLGADLGQ
jgi:hypothetical protein